MHIISIKNVSRCSALLATLLLLITTGCAQQQKIAVRPDPFKQFQTRLALPKDHPPSACDGWVYPELNAAGTANNWVRQNTTCIKCGADHPSQSPVVLDPTTADTESGWTLPTNLSTQSAPFTLTAFSSHNNFAFKAYDAMTPPLTINWYSNYYTWSLDEFHFHVPAEHAVVGRPISVLEMHVKAIDEKNKVAAVFAVQFVVNGNGGVPSLQPVLNAMQGQPQQFDVAPFMLLFQTQPIFIYVGSLTTPPCGQPVMFYVLQNPVPVDVASWLGMTAMLYNKNNVLNARVLQPTPLENPPRVSFVNP